MLCISMTIVMLSQFFMITVLKEDNRFHSLVGHALDIFSWVILWTPIDKLVFFWNPFLKEISILDRLMSAEVVMSVKHASELVIGERKYA